MFLFLFSAGKVIGKRGIVICNLKLTTKVDFVGAVQPVGNSLWQPVVIIGKIKHIIAAYNEISRMVYDGIIREISLIHMSYYSLFFYNSYRGR